MPYVGARLKALRNARKLTQDQLSEATGIPRTDISAIENDKKPLGPKRAAVFAAALEVSVVELQPDAEADSLGLSLQARQEELEAEVLRLAQDVTRLTRRVRVLERLEPRESPARGSGAK